MSDQIKDDKLAVFKEDKRLLNASFLIVDDMAVMRELVAACLEREGFHNIDFAENGEECLRKVEEKAPDILLLDINMPGVNGLDVCRQLRSNPHYQEIPILVQSAMDAPHERTAVFAAGATDFITKPLNPPELLSRVRRQLENRLLIQDLRNYQNRVAIELQVAHDMQTMLLPNKAFIKEMADRYGLDIGAYNKPSSELGGDLWGLWPIDDTRFGIFVTDFSGHGVGSALNTFRLQTLMDALSDLKPSPDKFLEAINIKLCEVLPTGQFATMLYAVVDVQHDKIDYAAAAAPHPFLVHIKEGDVGLDACASDGIPLGIMRSSKYPVRSVDYHRDARFILYSDALTETRIERSGEQIGEQAIIDIIKEILTGQTGQLVSSLVTKFDLLVGDNVEDDLTVISLRRN